MKVKQDYTGDTSHYRMLDIKQIAATAEKLLRFIKDEFPNSGLEKVCGELIEVIAETHQRCKWISKPHWGLRILNGLLILLLIGLIILAVTTVRPTAEFFNMGTFFEATEALVSELIFIGAGLFFVFSLETRFKRSRALEALNQFRVMAHVLDMHQLSKDPLRILAHPPKDPHNTQRTVLDMNQLQRYLDFCADMLSLVSKTAALHAQHLHDPVITHAVNEIEQLTSGLSNKIWHKINNARNYEIQHGQ